MPLSSTVPQQLYQVNVFTSLSCPHNFDLRQVKNSVRNEGGGGQGELPPPPNYTGPWHLCFPSGSTVGRLN